MAKVDRVEDSSTLSDSTLGLSEAVRKHIMDLDNARDEEARLALEARLVRTAVRKPLDPSQEVSAEELDALEHEAGKASAMAAPSYGMSPAIKVVRTARGELGYHEKGTNHTKYGKWYGPGFEASEWCDMFVSWVYSHAGLLKSIGGKHAYVPAHYDWFVKHKRFHRRGAKGGGPTTAAAIFIDFNGNNSPDHIGLVASHTDTHVYTIEGNRTDQVKAVKYLRSSHLILGYGYPDW